MDQNFSLNKDTHPCSNFRKQALKINFRLHFKRKKEGPKSFDLLEFETSTLQCQYSHLSHHMTTDFPERNQGKEGGGKSYPNEIQSNKLNYSYACSKSTYKTSTPAK